jgi:hypothetical protein
MRHDGGEQLTIKQKWEKTMDKITTIGLDLAKSVFHAVGCNRPKVSLPRD